jgi:aminoglycoside phosphotransferase (APT) family kinase protein
VSPSAALLRWAAGAVGHGACVAAVESKGSHGGGSPWLIRFETTNGALDAVLRVPIPNWIGLAQIETGAAALALAASLELPAPRLIAKDLSGESAGEPATLETVMRGSSTLPPVVTVARLRAFGAAIARVHAHAVDPSPGLPRRVRPIEVDDYALERRWAAAYRSLSEHEQPHLTKAFAAMTRSTPESARRVLGSVVSTARLHLADELVRRQGHPTGPTVFLHGDVWGGNSLWNGDTCVCLIDWKTAGVGDPGVDLGELRLQMALGYGADAPQHVLDGWEQQSGQPAANVAYWDAVAALNTPTELTDWPGFGADGHELGPGGVTRRRDDFLEIAVETLVG